MGVPVLVLKGMPTKERPQPAGYTRLESLATAVVESLTHPGRSSGWRSGMWNSALWEN